MNIPMEAVSAAKEAMREVTPPTGVSKADWLAEHGSFALIAGALEAAAPHMLADLRKLVEDMEAQPWTEMGTVRGMAALIRSTMNGTL
jgi:hypothetical protein